MVPIIILVYKLAFAYVAANLSSHADLFTKYCPYNDQCSRNATKELNTMEGRVPCCWPCRCDNLCTERDDCCLDAVHDKFTDEGAQPKCVHTLYASQIVTKSVKNSSYLMWADCLGPSDLQEKCKGTGSLEELIIVSDQQTGNIYRNKFCAICHNINHELIRWEVILRCNVSPALDSKLHSVSDIYDFFISNQCYLQLSPPEGLLVEEHQCLDREDSMAFVNECYNAYPDETVKQLCEQEFAPLVRSLKTGIQINIANIFCVMCSSDYFVLDVEVCHPYRVFSISDQTILVSFSAILNVDDPRTSTGDSTTYNCSRMEIFDFYKQICRTMYCPAGSQPRFGLCHFLYDTSHIYTYEFILSLEKLSGKPNSHEDLDLRSLIQRLGQKCKIKHLQFETTPILREQKTVTNNTLMIAAILRLTRESMENCISMLLLSNNLELDVAGKNGTKSKWKVSLFPDLLSKDEILQIQMLLKYTLHQEPIYGFNKCLYCRQIALGISDVHFQNGALVLPYSSKKLKPYEYVRVAANDSVRVCVDDYLGNASVPTDVSLSRETYHKDPINLSSAVVSTVCTSLSIVCLLFVIVTYLRFEEFNNAFGKLVLILCINVLLAQSFFQFGAGQTESATLCLVVSMFIHFWWLSVFSSKSVCMFFIYRTISSMKNRSRDKSLPKLFLSFIYIPPAVIVFICSFFTFVGNDAFHLGYGGKICFLKSNLSFGIFFYGPLSFVIAMNTGISVLAICKVKITSTAALQDNLRNQVLIYLRLSVFTGLTWVFAILYSIDGSSVFEYLFLVFNCSIGVQLFASLIIKSRTFALYSGCLGKPKTLYIERNNLVRAKSGTNPVGRRASLSLVGIQARAFPISDETSFCTIITQTNPGPITAQSNHSPLSDQTIPGPFSNKIRTCPVSGGSSQSILSVQTSPRSVSTQPIQSPVSDRTHVGPVSNKTSSYPVGDGTSQSTVSAQINPSPERDQNSPSPVSDQTSPGPVSDQTSPGLVSDQTSTCPVSDQISQRPVGAQPMFNQPSTNPVDTQTSSNTVSAQTSNSLASTQTRINPVRPQSSSAASA